MPQTPSRIFFSWTSLPWALSNRPSALCEGLSVSRSKTYWLACSDVRSGDCAKSKRSLGEEGVDLRAAHRNLGHSGVQLLQVDALLGLEVHRGQAERVGANPQIDVFGDEDGRIVRIRVPNVHRHHQDQVVGDLAFPQRPGHRALGGGHPQAATVRQQSAVRQTAALTAQSIQHARQLTGISTPLGRLFLELIHLFENEDGQNHLVVRKVKDGSRIVNQDVGIENEMLQSDLCGGRIATTGRPAREK